MGSVQLQTWQDCEDFIRGCVFMGTGGGGAPEWGEGMLRSALDEGLTIEWVDADDIPDDVWTATPYGMGSIAPVSKETLDEIERLELVDKFGDSSMAEAVKELRECLGQPIRCLVAAELGAGNTPSPLVTGARLGMPVVDGDYAGASMSLKARSTAEMAFAAYPSAPMLSAQLWLTGAPPIITFTWSRRPASSSASMSPCCSAIVVVRRAEAPTSVAPFSLTAATNSAADLSAPMSSTSKPFAVSMMPTSVLPIS